MALRLKPIKGFSPVSNRDEPSRMTPTPPPKITKKKHNRPLFAMLQPFRSSQAAQLPSISDIPGLLERGDSTPPQSHPTADRPGSVTDHLDGADSDTSCDLENPLLRILQVANAIEKTRFHIVRVGIGLCDSPEVLSDCSAPVEQTNTPSQRVATLPAMSSSSTSVPSAILDLHDNTRVVLLLVDNPGPYSMRTTKHIIRDFKERPRVLPIIVLMLRGAREQSRDPLAGKAIQELMKDASDVISLPTCMADLPEVLDTSVERAVRWHQERTRQVDKLRNLNKDKMYFMWQGIDRIIEGFPQMEDQISTHEPSNVNVGPCVLQELIGQGQAGTVYLARNDQLDCMEAVKVMDKASLKSLRDVRAIWEEYSTLNKLNHPSVVRCHGFFHDDHHICIRMEFAGQRNLRKVIRSAESSRLGEVQGCFLFQQVVAAIAYCHKHDVAHRDLKPENLFCSEEGSIVKLGDFGLAARVGELCKDGPVGTLPFMGPELLIEESYQAAPADVWSLAVLLLELLGGIDALPRMLNTKLSMTPETGIAIRKFFATPNLVFVSSINSRLGLVLSDAVVDLLRFMFQVAPEQRPTAAEVLKSRTLCTAAK